jgi:hypothetical protein
MAEGIKITKGFIQAQSLKRADVKATLGLYIKVAMIFSIQ